MWPTRRFLAFLLLVLLKENIIHRSTSSWSSPLHMVKKNDCYQQLNTATVPHQYPLPNISNFTSRISGSTVFSKLDLQKGYYQVPEAPEDVQKILIISPFRMYEFLRMPFGFPNAGNMFQRLIDKVLGDLPFCFLYVDDNIIFIRDLSSHVDNLCEVFLLCQKHGLRICGPSVSSPCPRLSSSDTSSPPPVVLPWTSSLPPSLHMVNLNPSSGFINPLYVKSESLQ